MTNDPDEIRRQIAATRAGLSDDVNELSDKVSPARIAQRQKDKVRTTVSSVKEHLMGSADDVRQVATDHAQSVGDGLSAAGDTVAQMPSKVVQQAKGSPVGAGVVAFGLGLLVSALIPASAPEAKVAAAVKEKAEPLMDQVQSVAKEVGSNLQEPAQQALESVKATATDAVDTVKEEGTSATDSVKVQAKDAQQTVKEQL